MGETGMALKLGQQFGKKLCEALGIDPHRVRSITLHVEPDEIVFATVQRFVEEDEADAVIRLIEEHRNAS